MFDRDAEPANPIETLVSTALRELDGLAEEHAGWGTPPSLWVATRQIHDGGIDTRWMPLKQLRFPERPGDTSTVDQVAEAARTIVAGVASGDPQPAGFFAAALITEGWVGVGESTTAPSQRPDRVEARLIAAVDTAGINYHHIRIRGRDLGTVTIDRGEPGGHAVGGTISDALHQIAEALAD